MTSLGWFISHLVWDQTNAYYSAYSINKHLARTIHKLPSLVTPIQANHLCSKGGMLISQFRVLDARFYLVKASTQRKLLPQNMASGLDESSLPEGLTGQKWLVERERVVDGKKGLGKQGERATKGSRKYWRVSSSVRDLGHRRHQNIGYHHNMVWAKKAVNSRKL